MFKWNRFNLDKDLYIIDDLIYDFFRDTFPRIVSNTSIYKDKDLYVLVINLAYFDKPDKYITPILKYIKDNFDLDKHFIYDDEKACYAIQCKGVTKDTILAIGGMCRILQNKSSI